MIFFWVNIQTARNPNGIYIYIIYITIFQCPSKSSKCFLCSHLQKVCWFVGEIVDDRLFKLCCWDDRRADYSHGFQCRSWLFIWESWNESILHISNISITYDEWSIDIHSTTPLKLLSFSHLRPDEDAEEQRSSLEQKLVGISFGWLSRFLLLGLPRLIEEMHQMDGFFAPLGLSRT